MEVKGSARKGKIREEKYACIAYTSKVARGWRGKGEKVFKINLFKIRYVDLGRRVFHVKQSHEFPNASVADSSTDFSSRSILARIVSRSSQLFYASRC